MGTEDNGLSLEGLADKLEALQRESAERLETLERENERMRSENAKLQSKVATLEGSGTPTTEDGEPPASKWSASDGQVSRRQLLSKAGAAAVGSLAAGALLLRDTPEASASHAGRTIDADEVKTHVLTVSGDSPGLFVYGGPMQSVRNSDTSPAGLGINEGTGPGVRGINRGTATSGTGVKGESDNGIGVHGHGPNGVYGTSGTAGSGAVYGKHLGAGHGVVGDANNATRNGVLGRNSTGVGVKGTSSAPSLGAVEGHNDGGGTGVVGVGKVGMLAYSHTDGWNAVWGRHTGNGYGVAGDSDKGTGVYGETTTGPQGVLGRAKGTSGQGVYGESLKGTGVRGKGKTGVVGASTGEGYGGQFQGGKAQLRLVPGSAAGQPTSGTHTRGEVYMDSKGTMFVCVADTTPIAAAKWRRVNTTAV